MFHIFVLVGHSGCGKTSLQTKLTKKEMVAPQGYTTRLKRDDDGDDLYTFLSPQEFLQRVNKEDIFEYVIYNNALYGLSKTEFDDVGLNVVVLEPSGIKYVKDTFGEQNVTCIYIESSELQRAKRMILRGDKEEDIDTRINKDREVFKNAFNVTDYKITSETEKEDYEQLVSIIGETLSDKREVLQENNKGVM